jgi:chemotaxis protein methyltransferase CheR
MKDETGKTEIENIEIELLLRAIYLRYNHDFRGYARASVKRRVKHRLSLLGFETISDLQRAILYDPLVFNSLLDDMSINVTEMFRDPTFYQVLRKKIIPEFGNNKHIKIWHAGCSTGEEVYSMAILLKEAGIYEKSLIYATDFDKNALRKAKDGIYPVEKIKSYTKNYKNAGGTNSFSDYFSARYDLALMDKSLKENIHFTNHNLVTDGVFGEMDMIICRNVLIYFSSELQETVFKLFFDSLSQGGTLCLGSKETIKLSRFSALFKDVDREEKIYRKK